MRCPYRKVRASFLLCKIISSLALSVIADAMPPCSPSGTSCPPPPAGGACQRERPWHGGRVSGLSAKCAEELKASPGRGSLSKREVLAVRADFIFLPRALPLGELPNKVRLRGRARDPNAIQLFCIQKLCYTVLNRRNGRAFTPLCRKKRVYGTPQLEQKQHPHFPFGLRLYAFSHQIRRHH